MTGTAFVCFVGFISDETRPAAALNRSAQTHKKLSLLLNSLQLRGKLGNALLLRRYALDANKLERKPERADAAARRVTAFNRVFSRSKHHKRAESARTLGRPDRKRFPHRVTAAPAPPSTPETRRGTALHRAAD